MQQKIRESVSKMSAKKKKKNLKFRDINFPAKNGITIFPKEFCHKIWLINKECKYNYIAETKFDPKKVIWL